MNIYAGFKNKVDMQLIKELTGLVGLIAVVMALISHLNNNFATKESHLESRVMILENRADIKNLKQKSQTTGAILCGMAIDLKLPTAKKACKDAISNN